MAEPSSTGQPLTFDTKYAEGVVLSTSDKAPGSGEVALVFGANGISGIAMISRLLQTPRSQFSRIIAVSRRPPQVDSNSDRLSFASVDLMANPENIAGHLRQAGANDVTHVFFYAYLQKEDEKEMVDVNEKLFTNSLKAIGDVCPKLKVILLQTGYKYYGTQVGGDALAPMPWKETHPRTMDTNFYYNQEDALKADAEKKGYGWIAVRPSVIIGISKGNFMSAAPTLAIHALACKFANKPLVFPGNKISFEVPLDISTAANNAEFQLYAATNSQSYNKAFNIHDGETTTWSAVWSKVSEYFGVPLASPPAEDPKPGIQEGKDIDVRNDIVKLYKDMKPTLESEFKKRGISPEAIDYATPEFLAGASTKTWGDQATLDEARAVGWHKTFDTWKEGLKPVFDEMVARKWIPDPKTL